MRVIAILLALSLSSPVLALPLNAQGPVKLDSGQIVGLVTGADEDISVYLGIPYAAPPVGDLRWKAPQPVERWKGVLPMRSFGPVAPQVPNPFGGVTADAEMSEDCLYLNVWTPAQSPDDRLPVMVWIHGGGFTYGAGSLPLYDGTNLAERGMIVVTFNYRLNIFGNFAHPLLTEESRRGASGNYGLLDQVAALDWVQDNIEAFGGNPENVTIFGESAGGRSVALHMASPLSRGMFHRGIAQSGALRNTDTTRAEREAECVALASTIGADELDDPLEYLRSLSWEELPDSGDFPSNPIVDGHFLEESPAATFARGAEASVPLLHGTTRDEMSYRMVNGAPRSESDYTAMVRAASGELEDRVLAIYPPPTSVEDIPQAAEDFATDMTFAIHQRNLAKWMTGAGHKTYLYYFVHVPPGPVGERLGAHHGAEIRYIFGNFGGAGGYEPERADRELSELLMDYWTHFAKTGNPNTTGRPLWPSYDPILDQVMWLGEDARSRFRERRTQLNALEGVLYPELVNFRAVPVEEEGNRKRRKKR